MAMSTLYLHGNFGEDAHDSKVLKLATWDPYPYTGDPCAALGSPGTTKEAAGSPGPAVGLPMGPGPGRLVCGSWDS